MHIAIAHKSSLLSFIILIGSEIARIQVKGHYLEVQYLHRFVSCLYTASVNLHRLRFTNIGYVHKNLHYQVYLLVNLLETCVWVAQRIGETKHKIIA
jgi:hypothetical protein